MKNPLATQIGIYAFGLALDAPLMCIQQRWPNTVHAADMDAVIEMTYGGKRTVRSVCGRSNLRLVKAGSAVVPWPPRLKGMPDDMTRCQECYVATGKMRPRVNYKAHA